MRNLDTHAILMADKDIDMSNLEAPRIFKLDKAVIIGAEEFTNGIFGDLRYKAPEVI